MSKNLLVLGASSDIAAACARKFAENGFDVTLAARDLGSVRSLASDIEIRYNVTANVVHFDAEDVLSHATLYSQLETEPEVVIYAAGYLGNQKRSESDTAELERVITVNFTGAASILSIVANAFEKRGSGSIIGISSVAGDRGRQSIYIYGSAKAGFSTFLAGMRHRFAGTKVHVMTVKPGFVATKMTADLDLPKALTATPEAVANAVYKGFERKSRTIYVKPIFRLIMWIIREVPEIIFVKTKL